MKVLDEVWMLVSETEGPDKNQTSVIYCIGSSAREAWANVLNNEVMGTLSSKEILKQRGYRARKVAICATSAKK